MDIARIKSLFDKEQRIEIDYPDVKREVTPQVVRHISISGQASGFIIYSHLDASNADQVIREQIDHFESLGQEFEWKVYDWDTPPDLVERLAAHGFEIEEPEALMVIDLEEPPGLLTQPVHPAVQRVTGPERVQDVVEVEAQVWQSDFGWLAGFLAENLHDRPDYISLYIAYLDGRPVSCAWTYHHAGTQFASLWGGTTLPEYRQRGLYSSLLAARAQEAHQRGARYLTVDASPMSRPILEKHGFQMIAYSHPCKWKVGETFER